MSPSLFPTVLADGDPLSARVLSRCSGAASFHQGANAPQQNLQRRRMYSSSLHGLNLWRQAGKHSAFSTNLSCSMQERDTAGQALAAQAAAMHDALSAAEAEIARLQQLSKSTGAEASTLQVRRHTRSMATRNSIMSKGQVNPTGNPRGHNPIHLCHSGAAGGCAGGGGASARRGGGGDPAAARRAGRCR